MSGVVKQGSVPEPIIVDMSQWQAPNLIDYDKLSADVDLAIIRIQHGSEEDKSYKTHIRELQKRKVPIHVYAFFCGSSVAKAQEEARLFCERTKELPVIMYWVDVESLCAPNMREAVSAFVNQVRQLTAGAKVGAYIANHLYADLKLNMTEFDGVWIPTYGANNGQYSGSNPWYPCDIHQYTDKGRRKGYGLDLDLSRLTNTHGKDLTYFTTPWQGSKNYETNPEAVYLTAKRTVYRSVSFTEANKTGKVLAKGTTVKVSALVFTKKGTPRLKVEGGYISASKKAAVDIMTTNPEVVMTKSKLKIYSSPNFTQSTETGKFIAKQKRVNVLGVSYSKKGTPRLKIEEGYISARAKYSEAYISKNPGAVTLSSKRSVYRSLTFKEETKTGKVLSKGVVVKVLGVEISPSGYPRLKVEGGYISAKASCFM